jgi:competence protein ComEC
VAGRWGGLVLATLYALLAGWGVPAQRTVWMLGGAVLLRSLGAPWPGWALCAVAAAGTVAVDPWALLQPGFWLSFLAVLMLLGMEGGGASPVDEPADEAADQEAAGAPVCLARSAAGPEGPVAHHPGIGAAEPGAVRPGVPGGVAGQPAGGALGDLGGHAAGLAGHALVAAVATGGWAIEPLQAWLQWLGGWPMAAWSVPAAGLGTVVLAVLGGCLLSLPLPWRLRALSALLCLPLLLVPAPRPAPGRFELLAADVGQGSAVLIRTAHHLLIHDAGPRYGADSDAGRKVLVPLLADPGRAPGG